MLMISGKERRFDLLARDHLPRPALAPRRGAWAKLLETKSH